MRSHVFKLLSFIFLNLLTLLAMAANSTLVSVHDPLPSWQDRPAKQAIIKFVRNVTDRSSSQYVSAEKRIATIDNDGTLWLEQPLYTEAVFSIDEVKRLAPQHPEWRTEEPFKAILINDRKVLSNLTPQDFAKIGAVTHSGMTVAAFQETVKNWLATTQNSHFNRPYTKLIYQPMLELMNYLRANDFKVYIVTGGGQGFVRAFAQQTYDIPPEQVIGTYGKTKYAYQNNQPVLIKQPDVELIDDKEGKPEAINLFIGRIPILAIGNSDGDQQMLEWASSKNPHLAMLIHHDDAKREYAYDTQSKIGTFSTALRQEAERRGWIIVSMKRDWRRVFPGLH